jgi:hypothetical protein
MALPNPLTAMASSPPPGSGIDREFISRYALTLTAITRVLTQGSALRRVALLNQVLRTNSSKYTSIDQTLHQHEADHAQRVLAATTMKRLAAEQWAINDKIRKTESDVSSHINYGIKLECRMMLENMSAKLPRELRDMVYDHIIGQRTATIARGDIFDHKTPHDLYALARDTWLSRGLLHRGYGNLIGRGTIPDNILLELVELWCKDPVFRFENFDTLRVFTDDINNTGELLPRISREQVDSELDPLSLMREVTVNVDIPNPLDCINPILHLADSIMLFHGFEAGTNIVLALNFPKFSYDTTVKVAELAGQFKMLFCSIESIVAAGYNFTLCFGSDSQHNSNVALETLTASHWTDYLKHRDREVCYFLLQAF